MPQEICRSEKYVVFCFDFFICYNRQVNVIFFFSCQRNGNRKYESLRGLPGKSCEAEIQLQYTALITTITSFFVSIVAPFIAATCSCQRVTSNDGKDLATIALVDAAEWRWLITITNPLRCFWPHRRNSRGNNQRRVHWYETTDHYIL